MCRLHGHLPTVMSSDYDITLHSDESSAADRTRSHFLDSIGLGEEGTGGGDEAKGGTPVPGTAESPHCFPDADDEVPGESFDETPDEGVVLSSQPEEFDLLMEVPGNAGERPVAYSPGSSSEQTRTGTTSYPPEDRFPATAERTETNEVPPGEPTDLEAWLTLECPECHGELVLQRRHLGIEGLCVWCHTPIVAAESPRDSTVRVFPVFGRIATPPTAPTTAPADADSPTVSPATDVADENEESAADPERPEFELPVELSAPPESLSEPSPEHRESPFPGPSTKEDISPLDLDALYATSGFGEPAPAATPREAPEEPGAPAFSAATPWGAPTFPAMTSSAPASPAPPESATTANASESLSPPDDFGASFPASGFGHATTPSELGDFIAPGQANSASDEAVPPSHPAPLTDDFSAGFAADGFFPATSPTPEPAPGSDTTAEEEEDFPAPSATDFSAGKAPENPTGFGFFSGISEENVTNTGWGISEPIGTASPDEAPVPFPSGAIPSPTADTVTNSFFGNSPFPAASPVPEPAPAADPSETPVSLFSETSPQSIPLTTPEPPPAASDPSEAPSPQMAESTFPSLLHPSGTTGPNVVSEPLGSKSKPKVRKGFLVLMVVIVGFAAGAALASFVLPVDEYVQAARTFMEGKFGTPAQGTSVLPVIAGETHHPGIAPPSP